MPARSCADHHRATLLHAQPGFGLPAIERGMPRPAGTGMHRRAFLLRSAGLGLSIYSAAKLLGPAALQAGVAQAAASGAGPVVVSVFLDGGVDNLSVLAPTGDPLYRRYRPTIGIPDSDARFAEDTRLIWHPSLTGLAALHGEGKLSVAPAVGYTDADQSHFTSRHYYEVGATDTRLQTGWLGRWIDVAGVSDNPLQGLSLDGSLAPSLATAKNPVAAIGEADDFSVWARGVWGDVDNRMQKAIGQIGDAHQRSGDAALREVGTAAANVMKMHATLAPLAPTEDKPFSTPVPYPNEGKEGFPRKLADLARLLGAGLPIRTAAVRAAGSYDTHDDQLANLPADLKLASDSLVSFQRDLEARGIADRVITVIWSEFGRRAEENGSAGCDHGAGGVGFVMGTRVAGTMIGEFPGLDRLDDDGNVRATSDYRALYCSILEQWLGTDAAQVIPGAAGFARPRIIR